MVTIKDRNYLHFLLPNYGHFCLLFLLPFCVITFSLWRLFRTHHKRYSILSITSTVALPFHLLFGRFVFSAVYWYPLLPSSIIDLIFFFLSRQFYTVPHSSTHTHTPNVLISYLIWSSMSFTYGNNATQLYLLFRFIQN